MFPNRITIKGQVWRLWYDGGTGKATYCRIKHDVVVYRDFSAGDIRRLTD